MTSFREARDAIFVSYDQGLTVTRSVCFDLLLYAGFVQASKPGFSARLVHSIWPRLRTRNFKLRKRREDVIPGKPEVSNTFLIKWKNNLWWVLKSVNVKRNKRKVDSVYNHVAATTSQDRSSSWRIWCSGEKSFPCVRTASFLGFFLSAAVVEVTVAVLMHRTIPQSPWVRACIPSYSVGSL